MKKIWFVVPCAFLAVSCGVAEDGGSSESGESTQLSSPELPNSTEEREGKTVDSSDGKLSFEWSANGFTQLPSKFEWAGNGGENAGVTLSVPETDNFVWVSECESGTVKTYLLLQPEALRIGDSAKLKFESDGTSAGEALTYPVKVEHLPYGDGADDPQSRAPVLRLPPSDPFFTQLKAGSWGYFQVGTGDDAAKLRISLRGAKRAWDAFLTSCSN